MDITEVVFTNDATKRIGGLKVYLNTSSVPVSISDSGLATFASDVALDFSAVTGIEAYIATTDGSTITLARKNKIAAGIGVLLRSVSGDAINKDVPVAATTDDVTGNIFVRGNDAAVATSADGKYNWILSKKSGVVGFYHANGNNVAKNRAYLQTVAAEARINLNFDDEDATAIEAVKTQNVENGQCWSTCCSAHQGSVHCERQEGNH